MSFTPITPAAPAPAAAPKAAPATSNAVPSKGVTAQQAHTSVPVNHSKSGNTPEANEPATTTGQQSNGKLTTEEMFELQVDGKTEKLSKTELLKRASLASGANRRFEEAAALRKQSEALLSKLRSPEEAIKLLHDPKLGLDKDQVRKAFENWYYESVVRPSEMTPEQRELHEAKGRLAEFETKEKERSEKERQEQERVQDERTAQEIQKELIETLDQSGLPKNRFTTSRLAYWLRVNEQQGLNAPRELIIQQVQKETRDIISSLAESSDGDVLVNLLGESTIKKLRTYDLQRIRARKGQNTPEPAPTESQEDKPREKITVQEWKRRLREWT